MKIQTLIITRKVTYTPGEYLEYCKEEGEEPTQDGFYSWVSEYFNEDFSNAVYEQEETLVDDWQSEEGVPGADSQKTP